MEVNIKVAINILYRCHCLNTNKKDSKVGTFTGKESVHCQRILVYKTILKFSLKAIMKYF